MKLGITVLLVLLSTFQGRVFAEGFEADCSSESGWDTLDFVGDGKITPVEGVNCPPGYGPRVLRVEGADMLAMPKGGTFGDGCVVALYREVEPRERDSDGVILFHAQFGADISIAHNTKERRPYTWVEQDNDTGFQLRQCDAAGVERTLVEKPGVGLVTDPWNVCGWIWQKIQFQGGHVRAKFWPAQEPEPADWTIASDSDLYEGRVGVIVHSGVVDIAYFAMSSSSEIAPKCPEAYLVFPQGRATTGNDLMLHLFTNRETAIDASYRLEASLNALPAGNTTVSIALPAGHGDTPVWISTRKPDNGCWLPLHAPLAAGTCMVSLTGLDAACVFPIAPVEALEAQLAEGLRHTEAFQRALDTVSCDEPCLRALCDGASAHAKSAMEHYRAGRLEKAETAIRYANEALAELDGRQGARLKALGADPKEVLPGPAALYPPRPDSKEITTVYHPGYAIRFGRVRFEAQSMTMGRTYRATIPWVVEGTSPDRDFVFHVTVTSPLGQRTVASCDTSPGAPTHTWQAGGTYEQNVELALPSEHPDPASHPAEAAILDEYHDVLVTVRDPDHGGTLLLDNPPGSQPGRAGEAYRLGQVYVSSAPIEIRGFEPPDGVVLAQRREQAVLRNVGPEPIRATALLQVRADTTRILYEAAADIEVAPGAGLPLAFDWKPDTAGGMTVGIKIIADGDTLAEACASVTVAPPEGYAIHVVKENHVGEDLTARVAVHAGKGPVSVAVFANGLEVGSAHSDGPSATVAARPWFGYYDVQADMGTFRYEKRIVATVVETRGPDIVVNGEPFLIKGTNVHGMDPSSPARTATMMRIMRELGFNTWRGDYPPRWQIDLAYELNSVYTVLAPFSCTSTRAIFARQDGPCMTTACEQTRVFIERYWDSAGVLLWNSCNEIEGDSVDFLLSQYPLYKRLDPYGRPVHYANLYGQDYSQGQDIMGINCYFSGTQTAESRHPIVQRSLDIARDAGLPLIYCEFNAFNGAVHSQGADAMRNLYDWGVEHGMAGGFQYMKGDSTSHPGIFDGGYNTHALYDNAIIKAFADAEVALLSVEDTTAKVRITNRRRFTLREVVWKPVVAGRFQPPVAVPDLPPGQTSDAELSLSLDHTGTAASIEGRLDFVTHFGVRSSIPVRLVAQ